MPWKLHRCRREAKRERHAGSVGQRAVRCLRWESFCRSRNRIRSRWCVSSKKTKVCALFGLRLTASGLRCSCRSRTLVACTVLYPSPGEREAWSARLRMGGRGQ